MPEHQCGRVGQAAAFQKAKAKGDQGEALIRLMFEWHGCQVLDFGVEKQIPNLRNARLHKNSKATEKIRALPDFLIVRETKDGLRPTFVEVKTYKRAPSRSRLESYKAYEAVCVIWVGPEGIQYCWAMKDKEITDFRPISGLTILEADEHLLEPLQKLAALLHKKVEVPDDEVLIVEAPKTKSRKRNPAK